MPQITLLAEVYPLKAKWYQFGIEVSHFCVFGSKNKKTRCFQRVFLLLLDYLGLGLGGDEEDRTPGLGVANAALSQLSYTPNLGKNVASIYYRLPQCQELVGKVAMY